MFWFVLILGIVIGAAAMLIFNIWWPETVDKLSAKVKEKL